MEVKSKLSYAELSDKAKQKVQYQYYQSLDYEWWDGVYECAKADGYELGFDIGRIFFSGFCSQGDGASWSGHIDIVGWLRAHCEDSIGLEAWVQLVREHFIEKHIPVGANGHHYCHSGTMSVGFWEGVFGTGLDEDEALLREDSIFQGMHYQDLLSLILHDPNMPYKNMGELADAAEQSAKDYADDIYKQLEKEWDYLCSEAVMIEHFDCNEIYFDEEGDVI